MQPATANGDRPSSKISNGLYRYHHRDMGVRQEHLLPPRALTLLPLLKYVGFALQFGTNIGEGGAFALYIALFPPKDPTEERSLTTYAGPSYGISTENLSRSESRSPRHTSRHALSRLKWPLFIWAVFGTGLTLSDGILTPAVSVTSAVGGIAVAKPTVSSDVVWISILFLLLLFGVQPLGTSRLGFLLVPITLVWLLLLGGTGIYNITLHPGIWRAYDPSRAILWFVRTKNYDYLAGVLLCITGCEAMFANLGQFNAASIRMAFGGLVYPMLVLAYLGQGARLIEDPSVLSNVFYRTIPGPTGGGLYWIVFIFAVLATLIASQAMITGTFSLIQQLVGMRAFPHIRIKHTSSQTVGQVYIGAVNWLLMVGTIAVVGGFGSSSALTLAYGASLPTIGVTPIDWEQFAVATVLFVTTTLISLSIVYVKRLSIVFGIAFLLFFGFLDGLFWGASLKKVPHGAWFPLGLGGLVCIAICTWTWCRKLEDKYDDANTVRLASLIGRINDDVDQIADQEVKHAQTPEMSSGDQFEGFHSPEMTPAFEAEDLGKGSLQTTALPLVHRSPQDDISDVSGAKANSNAETGLFLHSALGTAIPLNRIPVMAIFHRNDSAGRGVPHGFAAFLRRYPALPHVTIFLSTRIVGQPHVSMVDRYTLSKTKSFPGFYTCLMRIGYLDRPSPSADDLLPLLQDLEIRSASTSADAAKRMRLLELARQTETHVIPSFAIRSKRSAGRWNLWDKIRAVLVEELYARARVIFPDRTGLDESVLSTVHIGVPATI